MIIESVPTSSPPSLRGQRVRVAWQGLELSIPAEWNPVALSGNFSAGQALLAEFGEPRLGLRWKKVGANHATREVREQIARREADADADLRVVHLPDAVVCLDRRVPGRDVCVAWSAPSGRLVQLVYHARERDDVLVDEIVPTLADMAAAPWQRWAVLDLSCAVPAGFVLESHSLRAGDLRLQWRNRRSCLAVRQLALADRILQRSTLEQLVQDQQREQHLQYAPQQRASTIDLVAEDQRVLSGFMGTALRRRRLFWRWRLAPRRCILALHDQARNRIVLVQADDDSLARDVARTVGQPLN